MYIQRRECECCLYRNMSEKKEMYIQSRECECCLYRNMSEKKEMYTQRRECECGVSSQDSSYAVARVLHVSKCECHTCLNASVTRV